jgi:hypothetical protein
MRIGWPIPQSRRGAAGTRVTILSLVVLRALQIAHKDYTSDALRGKGLSTWKASCCA